MIISLCELNIYDEQNTVMLVKNKGIKATVKLAEFKFQ